MEQEGTQKCIPIFPYTHVLHLLMQGSLGVVFTSTIFAGCVFFLHDLGSWAFLSLSFTHVGAPSRGWAFPECEIHDSRLLCISSSRGQTFFIFQVAENFIFVMFLRLGFFPNVFCYISLMVVKMKIVFVLPSIVIIMYVIRFWPR